MNNRPTLAVRALGRLALVLHDGLAACVVACLLSSAVALPAWAYVDPSVMTYTIQALAGVAVALSAVAGVAFRRTRRAIVKALGIDANARKEVDPAWSRIDFSEDNLGLDAAHFAAHAPDRARAGEDPADSEPSGGKARRKRRGADSGKDATAPAGRFNPKWPWRIVLALVVCTFVVLTVYVMTSYETLAGNADGLVFGLNEAWRIVAETAAVAAVASAVCISVTRGRAFNIIVIVLFAVGLCCYIQALFLNGGIPTTDGRTIDWGLHWDMALVSSFVWIAVIVTFVVVGVRFKKAVQAVAGVVALALIVVQGAAIASLFADFGSREVVVEEAEVPTEQYMITEHGLFSVADHGNIIFFVLDTFDTADFMHALEEDPSLSQQFAGFTWFWNSVGAMSPTRYGAPFLWTDEFPQAGESVDDFTANRYRRSTFLSDLRDLGYSVGLYTDTIGDTSLLSDKERHELIYDKTVNVTPPPDEFIETFNEQGTLEILLRCALYRDLPWVAKPFCYFTTDQMNQAMVIDEPTNAEAPVPYIMNDAAWYQKLQERGLTVEENGELAGAYRFIHLQGTHEPYTLTADGTASSEPTSIEEQAKGSLKMVVHYLDELKRLGVFDDATIVITADHGKWEEAYPGSLPWVTSPVMMAKPAGQAADVELQSSDAEITAQDAISEVVMSAGGDIEKYGPTLFTQIDPGRDRRFILTYCIFGEDLALTEYKITGDVLNADNWVETGNVWVPANE